MKTLSLSFLIESDSPSLFCRYQIFVRYSSFLGYLETTQNLWKRKYICSAMEKDWTPPPSVIWPSGSKQGRGEPFFQQQKNRHSGAKAWQFFCNNSTVFYNVFSGESQTWALTKRQRLQPVWKRHNCLLSSSHHRKQNRNLFPTSENRTRNFFSNNRKLLSNH